MELKRPVKYRVGQGRAFPKLCCYPTTASKNRISPFANEASIEVTIHPCVNLA
jgi:hypothetical protein